MSNNPDRKKFTMSRERLMKSSAIVALGVLSLTACGDRDASAEHKTDTPSATASATPGATETSTPTPTETPTATETAPSTDAISEQLMSDSIDATRLATYPRQARVDAGLYVVNDMRDTFIDIDLFTAELPDGTVLWDNNPFDKPLDLTSSFEAAYNQNIFYQQLITSRRASADSRELDQDKAMKIAYAFTAEPNNSAAIDWEETIPNIKDGEIMKFSTETAAYTLPKNQEVVKAPFTFDDGTNTTKVTGVVRIDGDNYIHTFAFQPAPQLGEGKGVWLDVSSEMQK